MNTRLGELSWPELDGSRPVVLLPLGSVEQHGPHLPLATDLLVAQEVSTRAVAMLERTVVAPGQAYGASGEHEGFPGTVSIGQVAVHLLLLELGRSAMRWASRLVVVNGHGGNTQSIAGAVTRLRAEGRDVAWWPCAVPGGDAHAGRTETSLVRAILPAAVRHRAAAAGDLTPIAQLLPRIARDGMCAVTPNGVLGDPAGATADEGRGLLAAMAAQLAMAVPSWRVDQYGRLLNRRPAAEPGRAG